MTVPGCSFLLHLLRTPEVTSPAERLRYNQRTTFWLSTDPAPKAGLGMRGKEPQLTITLTPHELAELDRQNPTSKGNGGWQNLLVTLQEKIDRRTGRLVLDSRDLERIARYAFDYGNGGWERRLRGIFGRSLGPALGRAPLTTAA